MFARSISPIYLGFFEVFRPKNPDLRLNSHFSNRRKIARNSIPDLSPSPQLVTSHSNNNDVFLCGMSTIHLSKRTYVSSHFFPVCFNTPGGLIKISFIVAVYNVRFFWVQKWPLFSPFVFDFIFELHCTSVESYPRIYVKTSIYFFRVIRRLRTYHVRGTGTRYLYE